MNIANILRLSEKPDLYESGTAQMWTDPYISKQLLDVHLNSEIDLASRNQSTIQRTVDWILSHAGDSTLKILDLGCGPGLYAELLAGKGHDVTGVDFSENSIDHARTSASEKSLEITYINQNYLDLELEDENFDLVMMIYTDLGVLTPGERDVLLSKVRTALKPGGILIFDVLNDQDLSDKVAPRSWDCQKAGFWRDAPYVSLSDSFLYEDEKVVLFQHIVLTDKDTEIYRFWTNFFSHDDLTDILKKHGFKNITYYEDVLPVGDKWSGENVTFCKVIK